MSLFVAWAISYWFVTFFVGLWPALVDQFFLLIFGNFFINFHFIITVIVIFIITVSVVWLGALSSWLSLQPLGCLWLSSWELSLSISLLASYIRRLGIFTLRSFHRFLVLTHNFLLIWWFMLRVLLLLVILGLSLYNSLFLLLFELSQFILPHFLQFLLNFESVLRRSNDTSLRNLLSVLVVENHAHGVLQILKFLGIDGFDLTIRDFLFFDQWEQDVSREALDLQVELLGHLALFQALVDAPDVLSECWIVIVLDAIVRSGRQKWKVRSRLMLIIVSRFKICWFGFN